jgi:hypothetical protein
MAGERRCCSRLSRRPQRDVAHALDSAVEHVLEDVREHEAERLVEQRLEQAHPGLQSGAAVVDRRLVLHGGQGESVEDLRGGHALVVCGAMGWLHPALEGFHTESIGSPTSTPDRSGPRVSS